MNMESHPGSERVNVTVRVKSADLETIGAEAGVLIVLAYLTLVAEINK
ncbi:hypothetical protein E2C01_005610 [Portunus trituberculatus]|uniref:Uncharacterized protein n=1 Tax=Portunus trituberculatus TaxID=210409 RepID=A0A5B7CUU1_PORTR|nr:hypothetical protein [Portunus trituberculatus]